MPPICCSSSEFRASAACSFSTIVDGGETSAETAGRWFASETCCSRESTKSCAGGGRGDLSDAATNAGLRGTLEGKIMGNHLRIHQPIPPCRKGGGGSG